MDVGPVQSKRAAASLLTALNTNLIASTVAANGLGEDSFPFAGNQSEGYRFASDQRSRITGAILCRTQAFRHRGNCLFRIQENPHSPDGPPEARRPRPVRRCPVGKLPRTREFHEREFHSLIVNSG